MVCVDPQWERIMLNQDMNCCRGGPEDESLAQVDVVPVDLHRQRFVGDDSQTLDVVLDYGATSADVGMVADHPGHAEEDPGRAHPPPRVDPQSGVEAGLRGWANRP